MDRSSSAPLLTYHDYVHFPDDERVEILEGVAYVVPAPTWRHQGVVGRLYWHIVNFVEVHPECGRVAIARFDVVLSDHDVVQPDIVFLGDLSILSQKNARGSPTWVIEVVSDPRRDRVLKLAAYAKAGVSEYWIVDPVGDTIDVFLIDSAGGGYGAPTRSRPGDAIGPRLPDGLTIDVADVLRRDR